MRSSFLLSRMNMLLVMVDMSLGSSANQDRHSTSISAYSVPVHSLTTPNFYPVARMAAPKGGNRHFQYNSDVLDLSNRPSPALIQRHHHILNHLHLHATSPSLAKRSLAGDLIIMGFRLIWEHADVIVSTYLAHHRTTEYYQKLIIELGTEFSHGATVQNHIITYGAFRLTFSVGAETLAEHFPEGIEPFIMQFAQTMLLITTHVVIGTYKILAYSAMASIWITMVIVENAPESDLVTPP